MKKSWKNQLLSSGLPLEYEVKQYLAAKTCIANLGYSYSRSNEQQISREVSYDVDASWRIPPHYVTLMVECKYRNPGVQWVWTAEAYGGPGELYQNSFLHPLDEFVSQKFPFKTEFPRQLGPCCSKGVELHPEGASESAIVHATSQVAHAFGTKIADAIERQVRHLCPGILVHYHVPVIVTTAPMFRLFEDASVANISAAETIEDVSSQEDCVVVKYAPSLELKEHNRRTLESHLVVERDELAHAVDGGDVDAVLSRLVARSPEAIVVISIARAWRGFDRLLQYVGEVLQPSDALLAEYKQLSNRRRRWTALFERAENE